MLIFEHDSVPAFCSSKDPDDFSREKLANPDLSVKWTLPAMATGAIRMSGHQWPHPAFDRRHVHSPTYRMRAPCQPIPSAQLRLNRGPSAGEQLCEGPGSAGGEQVAMGQQCALVAKGPVGS